MLDTIVNISCAVFIVACCISGSLFLLGKTIEAIINTIRNLMR